MSVDSAARASALQSGTVDIVFWMRVPSSNGAMPIDYDRPEGIDVSAPYYEDEIVHVGRK